MSQKVFSEEEQKVLPLAMADASLIFSKSEKVIQGNLSKNINFESLHEAKLNNSKDKKNCAPFQKSHTKIFSDPSTNAPSYFPKSKSQKTIISKLFRKNKKSKVRVKPRVD